MARSLRAVLLAGTLLALAAAPSVAPVAAQTPTDLSMWVFVPDHGDFMVRQAERWSEANPDRPITVTYTNTEYAQMHDNLVAAILAGTGAPDLADIEISKFALFTKDEANLHLLDLTDVVAPYLPDLVATRMAPYQAYGKQLGIDYHLGAYLTYYNKELLDQAGINPDDIHTLEDWIAAGKTYQEATGKTWGAIEDTGPFSARALMLLNGGGAYNADGELILDSQQNIDALQKLSDLVNVDGVAKVAEGGNVHTPEFFESLQQGNYASLFMPQWYMIRFPTNMAELCGKMIVRPMIVPEGSEFTTTMGGGTGTAVTDQTPAEEQELAKEFLAFAKLTPDAQKELWTDLGFDPFRLDVYEDPALLEPDECFSGEVPFEYIKAELGNVAPEYTGPLYPDIATELTVRTIPDIVEGGVPPAEALAAAVDTVAGD